MKLAYILNKTAVKFKIPVQFSIYYLCKKTFSTNEFRYWNNCFLYFHKKNNNKHMTSLQLTRRAVRNLLRLCNATKISTFL